MKQQEKKDSVLLKQGKKSGQVLQEQGKEKGNVTCVCSMEWSDCVCSPEE